LVPIVMYIFTVVLFCMGTLSSVCNDWKSSILGNYDCLSYMDLLSLPVVCGTILLGIAGGWCICVVLYYLLLFSVTAWREYKTSQREIELDKKEQ
jgi:hypothetical protein